MEPEGSLPHSKMPATCTYPEPARSSPYPQFLKIHLNIILPSRLGSPKWSLSFRFPHQNPVHASPLHICSTLPAHLILLDFITRPITGEVYRSLSSSSCNFLHSPITSSLLGPNTLLNTLFSNTLSLRSSLNMSDQVSHCWRNVVTYHSTTKSRRMRWAGLVARMVEGRGVYRVLVRQPEGKRPLGRPRRSWEDNI